MKKLEISLEQISKMLFENRKRIKNTLNLSICDAFEICDDYEYFQNIVNQLFVFPNWHVINNNSGLNYLENFQNIQYNHKDDIVEIYYMPMQNLNCKQLFKHLDEFSSYIQRSYDNQNFSWENNAWENKTCQGDDDLDYNSSAVDEIIQLLELYLILKCSEFITINREFTYYCKEIY